MTWSADAVYGPVFGGLAPATRFALQDVDYTLGDRKCGGNAQSISRERWVHHTSFLWRLHADRMRLLKHPDKTPAYRAGRAHMDFLTPVSAALPPGAPPGALFDAVEARLAALFDVTPATPADAEAVLARPQERASNTWVDALA